MFSGVAPSRVCGRARASLRRRWSWQRRHDGFSPRPEFPELAIAGLTAAAGAAVAADDIPEAERLLAEARQVAETKGAVASLARLDAVLSG
jgi:hypothetical protein